MIWTLLSCLSAPEQQPKAPTLESWSEVAQTCIKGDCTPELCNSFYAAPPPPTQEDAPHLVDLCSWLESDVSAQAQFCSIKACLYLPTVSSVDAQKMLFKDQPNTAGKKMARQAIVRTFLDTPRQFSELITSQSATQYADRWLRVAVAEAECNEGSIAKRLQMNCRDRAPILSMVLWDWALKLQEPSAQLAAFNLAMSLDQKSILPKVLSELQAESSKHKKHMASVLQLAMLKGLKLDNDDSQSIQNICKAPPVGLVNLCISLQ